VRVWRLALARHHELDGEGARLYGGRWNSPGVPVVYAATHLSLALLEQLVHVSPERLPDTFRAFAIELPDDAPVETIKLSPSDNDPIACRHYGDNWATALRSAMLIVPSAVVPATLDPDGISTDERNVVLNPRHASAVAWRVVETSFRIDPRLKRAVTG
jgi:RES domain-containing protein